MNYGKTKLLSLIIMIILLICMVINRFISPLPDALIRVIGGVMLINLFVLSYSTVKSRYVKK